MSPCGEQREEGSPQDTACTSDKYFQRSAAASLMECNVGCESASPLLENRGKFSLYMIYHKRREEPVTGESVFDFVFQERTVVGIVKNMGVGPAGKWSLFLDIPKHFARIVFDMVGVKVKRKGACVHFQFYPAPGTYTSLVEDDTGPFPGWQETFQGPRSAVI